MDNKLMLMIPGPTPVPEAALLAMAKHPMGHRSKEFDAIFCRKYRKPQMVAPNQQRCPEFNRFRHRRDGSWNN
jgi:aspartate aminotransferase-like enzyme